ncbi:unnamed protein product [Hymenolepis diminuta]|uniref:SEC7 domain-containing protein n=1 Tax=Hymenolepis diminuta TaxID=6216 RepID=A0A0R3SUS9_HYMDI|nr:unnamed protein product [Hymenolepis diminuta]
MITNMQQTTESSNNLASPGEINREPQSSSVPQEFVEMFISRALEKIATEKQSRRSSNIQLRDACREGIEYLKTRVNILDGDKNDSHLPPQSQGGALLTDEKLLLPFELASRSRNPKIVAISLDCLQKLIAYGHVPNDAYDSSGTVRIIERIVQTICSCFSGVNTDEAVQLQVIKALLTVVTSSTVEVHERDILLVVRTCYNIYMATKNVVNQTTARGTLTQMLNVIFQRMEQATLDAAVHHDQKLSEIRSQVEQETSGSISRTSGANLNDQTSINEASVNESIPGGHELVGETSKFEKESAVETSNRDENNELDNESTSFAPQKASSEKEPFDNNVSDGENGTSGDKSDNESDKETLDYEKPVENYALDHENPVFEKKSDSENDNTEAPINENQGNETAQRGSDFNSKVEEPGDQTSHQEEVMEEQMQNHEDKTASEDGSEITTQDDSISESNKEGEPSREYQSTESTISSTLSLNRETSNRSTATPLDSSDETAVTEYYFAHVTQKDAFLVFRSLCKLAMKPLATSNPNDPRSHELRSKILSLQLLLSILQQPGPAFKSNSVFITAIKQYLCVALSKNGVSSAPEVFELSLALFLSLLNHFKQHLKIQIEVFFKEMLFVVLDSSTASYEHKCIVVETLQRICLDKQCIVDAYLNYDCDLERVNIFEKLVICLAKVAQGRPAVDTRITQPQLQNLRKKGLECLVLILKCMVRWSGDFFNVPNDNQSFLGSEPASMSTHQHDTDSGSSVRLNQSVGDDPEDFESRKALKEVYEKGIYLFNRGKITKGLDMLQENNLLGTSVEDVAVFLHNESRLCRTAVGEFLGQNDTFSLEVMYAYIDCFDFSGMDFLPALRLFISGFWLPGEAQKIDRLMEKFAARYCACNPNNTLFSSADTAYVLAFSIIMLTTDLHSEKIKEKQKMSKEEYIRMNRGINDSQDLPREYLGKIYDEIAQCGMQMPSDNVPLVFSGNNTTTTATNGVRDIMESVSHMQSEFTSATHFEHVRPMFKLVWTPFLAAFSVGLQDCDDSMIAHHCLEGIQCAIRIACTFRMELERDAYVQALARFTLLLSTTHSQSNSVSGAQAAVMMGNHYKGRIDSAHGQPIGSSMSINSLAEASSVMNPTPEMMKSKNIDSIRTLISVAQTNGNYLGHSWLHILRCISQLESANVIATSTARSLPHRRHASHADEASTRAENGGAGSEGDNGKLSRKRSGIAPGSLAAATVDSRKAAVLQEVMGETGSRSVVVAVDKIFSGSVRLDGDAIVDFVQALCQVSLEELALPQPRTFSLQKVVEISYYNIGRIRLQWSRIWEHIGQHFTTAGRSTNEDVAIFAVDSLRQLAVKLIEKGELPNFHFQKECIRLLIQSQWVNIRSGWTNIFLVLYVAAGSTEASVIELAFNSCAFVINTVFPNNFYLLVDSFPVFIKALSEFACNLQFPDTSMEAIRLIRLCARVVSERATQFAKEETVSAVKNSSDIAPSGAVVSSEQEKDDENAAWKRGWMPIFYELFRVINNCKLDVRTRGLTVFFEVIKSYGSSFVLSWWIQIFKLIFSIFEHGRDTSSNAAGTPTSQHQQSSAEYAAMERMYRQRLFSGDQLEAFGITYRIFTSPADRSEWLNTTCNHALYSVVDIFSQFFDKIADDLLVQRDEKLQDHEQLARSGTSCLETIVLTNGAKFDAEKWTMTVNLLVDLFKTTIPHELLTWRPDPTVDGATSDEVTVKRRQSARTRLFLHLLVNCIVQYELIQTVDNILFVPSRNREEDALILRETRRSSAQLNLTLLNGTPMPSTATIPLSPVPNNSKQVHTPEEKRLIEAVTKDPVVSPPTPSVIEPIPQMDFGETEELVNGSLPLHKKATIPYVSYENRLTLVQCLMESHRFAKVFNSNIEQRNVLWEAGFKAKAKPNLLKQETHSLSTALRILFILSEEDHDHQKEAKMLQDTIMEAIVYYRSLPVDGHRQAWDSCLLLTLTRLVHLTPDTRFAALATPLYTTVCDLVGLPNLSPEISVLLRAFLLRTNSRIAAAQ